MDMLDAMNSILTPEAVMWTAAAVSLALLVLVRPVTAVLTSARRDSGARAARIVLILALFLVVTLPFLILVTGEPVAGFPCGCFLLIFPLFCYYFGKGVGHDKGRRGIMDLVGLDEYEGIEDAQDRLYESRLRFPGHEEVAASIARLARAGGAAKETKTDDDVPPDDPGANDDAPRRPPSRNSEILDVMVEEV